jgi:G6PDH family F420-dependent oxidoreductase
MATLGIFLSSEEHSAPFLADTARKAEAAGFSAAWISDHFHPWTHRQGESPFVWSTIGAIAAVTDELRVTTAVTCPTVRLHPAIVAQAAATSATLLPGGRFALGVGTGEALNEHIAGAPWPNVERRLSMLEDAVEVMRMLWSGGMHSHHGPHYTLDRAQLFSLPDEPPPVIVSGFGAKSIAVAARIGDGYASTMPDPKLLQQYRDGGGTGPAQAGLKVCYGEDEAACVKLAHELWPNEGLSGELAQVLFTPAHYEAACALVTEDMIAQVVPCGPDSEKHAAAIQKFFDAGYDEVYVQQIGDDQDGFLRFYEQEILPRFS